MTASRPTPHLFALGTDYRTKIKLDGTTWRLQKLDSCKGGRKRWTTIGKGKITDTDPDLERMMRLSQAGTSQLVLKVALGLQRASMLYRSIHPPSAQPQPPVAPQA